MPSDAFVGEIYMFAGNFAIQNTALCNGQLIQIRQNTALFAILGTSYGGNGTTTFALPNLQGSSAIHPKTDIPNGVVSGAPTVTLQQTELPMHTHSLQIPISTGGPANTATAINSLPASSINSTNLYSATAGTGFMTPLNVTLDSQSGVQGGNQPHNNLQPYLAVNFLIALQGIFPQRS